MSVVGKLKTMSVIYFSSKYLLYTLVYKKSKGKEKKLYRSLALKVASSRSGKRASFEEMPNKR